MTTPALPRWRRALADKLARGRVADLEHEVRRLTVALDLSDADTVAARRTVAVMEQHAQRDPDRAAHTTLGAVLHRATRDGDMATIRVPVSVLDHWLAAHRLTSEARVEKYAKTPMPDVEPGPGDRSALPPNPSYAGAVS